MLLIRCSLDLWNDQQQYSLFCCMLKYVCECIITIIIYVQNIFTLVKLKQVFSKFQRSNLVEFYEVYALSNKYDVHILWHDSSTRIIMHWSFSIWIRDMLNNIILWIENLNIVRFHYNYWSYICMFKSLNKYVYSK